MNPAALEYLNGLKARRPDLAADLTKIADDYRNKLWHQLTKKSEALVERPDFAPELANFYQNFLETFEARVNPLAFVKMAIVISRQHPPEQAIEFLKKVSDKISTKEMIGREAKTLAVSERARLLLEAGRLDDCKTLLADAKKDIDAMTGADSAVYAAYYLSNALFQKRKGTPAEFYRNAVLYLAYAPLDTLPPAFRKQFAFDLILAALIGEGIYLFGDLLAQPILRTLEQSDVEWIVQVLRAFNSGNIKEWKVLCAKYTNQIAAQGDLQRNSQVLAEKIAILGLLNLLFHLPSDQRTVSFQNIATHTELALGEVELLVMKALSIGLIKGSIDEVDKTVTITWVQPRVLMLEQIQTMHERLHKWNEKVHGTFLFMESETHELFT